VLMLDASARRPLPLKAGGEVLGTKSVLFFGGFMSHPA
jgi:hypothetical protein